MERLQTACEVQTGGSCTNRLLADENPGNIILNVAQVPGYTGSFKGIALVGFVGGLLSSLCVRGLKKMVLCLHPEVNTSSWWSTSTTSLLTGALTGVLGASILHQFSVDDEGLDVPRAALAGILGAVVLIALDPVFEWCWSIFDRFTKRMGWKGLDVFTNLSFSCGDPANPITCDCMCQSQCCPWSEGHLSV